MSTLKVFSDIHLLFSAIFILWKENHAIHSTRTFFYVHLPIENVRMSAGSEFEIFLWPNYSKFAFGFFLKEIFFEKKTFFFFWKSAKAEILF